MPMARSLALPFLSLHVLVAALLLCLPASAQKGQPKVQVSMIASTSRVGVGIPFGVEIRADVSGDDVENLEPPDFGELEVVGRRVSRPFSFSFGFGSGGQHAQVRNEVVYGFTLRALHPGTYKIPPAVVVLGKRKVATQGLSVEVVEGMTAPQAQQQIPGLRRPMPQIPGFPPFPGMPGFDTEPEPPPDANIPAPPTGALDGAKFDQNLFVRTVVDRKEAFVGEQLTVTLYLYVRGGLSQNPSLAREPTTDGFWVQDLLPMQRNLASMRQDVQGRPFNVYVLRRFAAFPMREGTLEVGAPIVELTPGQSIFDMLNGPQKAVRRDGVPVQVTVKPLPAHKASATTLHVGTLALTASLSQPAAKVGDGVTLDVRAEGTGNLRELRLPAPNIEGMEVLAPEIKDMLASPLDRVGGTRTFRFLLLPRRGGTFTVPPFSADVFDPEKGSYSATHSGPLTLEVAAQAAAETTKPAVAGPVEAEREELPVPAPRPRSALLRRAPPLDSHTWYPWTVGALPLLAGLAYAGRALRERLAARAHGREPSAMERARTLLAEAERMDDTRKALGALIRATHAGIEAFAGESLGGFPASAIPARLEAFGLPAEAARRIGAVLSRIEDSRFLPGNPLRESLTTTATEVRSALVQLEKSRRTP
jgi:hypothetical protein